MTIFTIENLEAGLTVALKGLKSAKQRHDKAKDTFMESLANGASQRTAITNGLEAALSQGNLASKQERLNAGLEAAGIKPHRSIPPIKLPHRTKSTPTNTGSPTAPTKVVRTEKVRQKKPLTWHLNPAPFIWGALIGVLVATVIVILFWALAILDVVIVQNVGFAITTVYLSCVLIGLLIAAPAALGWSKKHTAQEEVTTTSKSTHKTA